MNLDITTKNEIKSVLENLAHAYAKRNLNDFLSFFAPDKDVILYGTGADEKRIGIEQIKAQVKRDWEQTDSASLIFHWISISGAGNVAWTAADAEFNLKIQGQEISISARITCVLEKRSGKWLIVQSHFSTPMADQEEGYSY